MASAHSTSWAEADMTSPSRDRALAVSRMVIGSVIRGAGGIRATPPSGPGSLEPLQCPTYHGSEVFRACFGTSAWKRVSGWRYLRRPHEKIRYDVVNDRICQTKVA